MSILGISYERIQFNSDYLNYYDSYSRSIETNNKILILSLLLLMILGIGYGFYHLISNFRTNKVVIIDSIATFFIVIQGFIILVLCLTVEKNTELRYHVENTAEYFALPLICGSMVFLGEKYLNFSTVSKISIREVVQINNLFILQVFAPITLLVTYYLCLGYWATIFIILFLFILTFIGKMGTLATYWRKSVITISQSQVKVYVVLLVLVLFSYTLTYLNSSHKKHWWFDRFRAVSWTESILYQLIYPEGIHQPFDDIEYLDEYLSDPLGIDRQYTRLYNGSRYKVLLNDQYAIYHEFRGVLTNFIYDDVKHFSQGLAAVKRRGLWGFVDKSGEEVIPSKYDDVGYFSEGLAAVKKDTLWGFINEKGEEVIKPKFQGEVDIFSNGQCIWWPYAPKEKDTSAMIDRNGNWSQTPSDSTSR